MFTTADLANAIKIVGEDSVRAEDAAWLRGYVRAMMLLKVPAETLRTMCQMASIALADARAARCQELAQLQAAGVPERYD